MYLQGLLLNSKIKNMTKALIILATAAYLLTGCKNEAKNKEAKTGEATEIKAD